MRAEHAKFSRASTDRQLTLVRDADVPAAQADEEEGVRWRGVRLKPEAFDHLGLPVAVQHSGLLYAFQVLSSNDFFHTQHRLASSAMQPSR